MRAITYDRYGSPDVLQLSEVPTPQPADDELLIRVRAAEATKADCEMRSFRFSVNWFWIPLRLAFGVFRPRRKILGSYFAGEIVAVGSAVDRFSVGDAVFGTTGLKLGAYGEYVALPAALAISRKPDAMDFVDAAAVPLGGLNALHFMRRADINAGDKVLINGAGGSIGAHAVQIAKAAGAHVTAVDDGIKEAFLRRIGADHVVNYRDTDFTADGPVYDVILDMVAQSSYDGCISSLRPGGHYLKGNPRFSDLLRSVITPRFSDKKVTMAFAKETREELDALREMIDSGSIVSIVDRVFDMVDAAEAHRIVEAETRLGAVVIDLDRATPPTDSVKPEGGRRSNQSE